LTLAIAGKSQKDDEIDDAPQLDFDHFQSKKSVGSYVFVKKNSKQKN
jgi:hypothetical protein